MLLLRDYYGIHETIPVSISFIVNLKLAINAKSVVYTS